jgi:hypothetical protein
VARPKSESKKDMFDVLTFAQRSVTFKPIPRIAKLEMNIGTEKQEVGGTRFTGDFQRDRGTPLLASPDRVAGSTQISHPEEGTTSR